MKHFYKLMIVFLLPIFAAAQSNYQPGYVVTLKGDTLKGFIDLQSWDSNPSAIAFKSAVSDHDKKTFTTNEIGLFNVNGRTTYKKYTCSISLDLTDPSHIVEGRDTSFKVGTVFLQVLQQGKNVALYSYADNIKTRFYIGEAPGYAPTELVYRRYFDLAAKNTTGRTVDENGYLKQLFALAIKYNALDDKLTSKLENNFTSYSKGDLMDIVSRINNISKAEFDKKYSEHGKVNFYVSGGANISSSYSDAQSSYSIGGGKSSASSLPAFALGVNFIPNPAAGRAELRMDISVNPTHFNSSYPLKVSPYTGAKTSYDQLGVFLTPQALYNIYNEPNFKFYVGFGIALTYFSYSNPIFTSQPSGNALFPVEPFYFNKLDNAFLFKAGFKIQKSWEIYFDYYTATAATKSGYFAISNQNTLVGLTYFFGK
jgi:hypothetical protein